VGATYTCECGWSCCCETGEELVCEVERHLADAHPQVAGALTRADVLAIAEKDQGWPHRA
jgi:hypothetical protein